VWIQVGVHPDILVSDNGELILKSSTLTIKLDQIPNYSTNGRITIQDQAIFTAEYSKIRCTEDMRITCVGNSSISLIGFEYFGKTPDSTLHWTLEDKLPEHLLEEYRDHYRLTAEGNSSLVIDDCKIGYLSISGDSSCNVSNSEINHLVPWSQFETKIKDSRIGVLSVSQNDSEFMFTGKAEGFYREWHSKEFFGSNIAANVRMLDSGFDHLWLSLSNCTSEIIDAELWVFTVYQGTIKLKGSDVWIMNLYYGDSVVESSNVEYFVSECVDGSLLVEDCDVQWMGLTGHNREAEYHIVNALVTGSEIGSCNLNSMWITDKVDLRFEDVTFNNLTMKPAPIFDVVFENCIIEDWWKIYSQRNSGDKVYMSGQISMKSAELETFPNVVIIREHEIMVLENGQPVPGAQLQLFRNNTLWRSEVIGIDGSAFFNITWVDITRSDSPWIPLENPQYNMTDTLEMLVNGEESVRLSVTSDNPIIITNIGIQGRDKNHRFNWFLLVATLIIIVIILISNVRA
jgi:hypothetical protein